jgi:hypothetical protein
MEQNQHLLFEGSNERTPRHEDLPQPALGEPHAAE